MGTRDQYEENAKNFTDEKLVERAEWFFANFGSIDSVLQAELLRRFKEKIR